MKKQPFGAVLTICSLMLKNAKIPRKKLNSTNHGKRSFIPHNIYAILRIFSKNVGHPRFTPGQLKVAGDLPGGRPTDKILIGRRRRDVFNRLPGSGRPPFNGRFII